MREWNGFVWCNPPYGKALGTWLNRMAVHGNGIALVFARTETRAFFDYVWPFATSILFLKGRLTFNCADGSVLKHGGNSGGPSVLIGYGATADRRLKDAHGLGAYIQWRDPK